METTQPEPQLQPDAEKDQTGNLKRFVLDILETLILAVVLYFGINAVSVRVRVDGFSMNPTLQDGEYILINRLAYKLGNPVRGDIVVFSFPMDPKQDLIKRVIGLPGESISVQDGRVMIMRNGEMQPMEEEMTLPDGTRVMMDGTMRDTNGTIRMLAEGETILVDGMPAGAEDMTDGQFKETMEDEELRDEM